MATQEFKTYLYFLPKHSTPEDPQFKLDDTPGMDTVGWHLCSEHTFTLVVPEYKTLLPKQLAALEAQKQEVREKFALAMRELDDRINSLLALEMSV